MSFRKKFNLKSPHQCGLTSRDWFNTYNKACKCADVENKKREDNLFKKNNTCPACYSTKVVEKFLGYDYHGSMWGSTLKKCRHCSDCGNDWETTNIKKVYGSHFISLWFKQLSEMIDDGDSNEEILHTCTHFTNLYAESFKKLYDMTWIDSDRPKRIKLKKLRTIFKSVFDQNDNN